MQVTVNGIDTHYVLDARSGGPALTFVHQLGGDHTVWDQVAGHFRHRYNVLRYDVRGHGASAISREPFGFAQLAADLNAILDTKGVTRTHLVGVSMGGMIAQQFAIDYPARVLSLTLCDTSSRTPHEARDMWTQRAALVRREGTAMLANATMERWFTPEFRQAHGETVKVICDVLLRTASEGYAMACEALRDFDAHDRLAELRVPALAVAGRYDGGTPAAATRALADAIAGARFEILDAAHLAPVEESHRFTALLETFLHQSV
ncbi:3-oxoadipate enol-lactonase [Paraburkholderia dinghuensis]|uniref:3-oxoadipate enol-lactonase n=1 Tax=Paraburkholderia dinghuensis TaxID=2305225 RepID=A0A3N6MLW9_9BURK|nr:3-oxoadipate enol-lactonase [Paraburkholderia dinghuensis]RQH04699.1 3-oxoadipate enol-lactonase [Paraburkholderia dinghuensis]